MAKAQGGNELGVSEEQQGGPRGCGRVKERKRSRRVWTGARPCRDLH